MAKTLNLEALRSVKAQTRAFLEIRKPLSLTPAELTLLGISKSPIVVSRSIVRLKCSYRSTLNDKRRGYGLPELVPENTLPWGEWEIEDAIVRHESNGEVTRYLRYYDDPDSNVVKVYFDAVTGEEIKGYLLGEIERLMKRRYARHKTINSVISLTSIDYIDTLSTLTDEAAPDVSIIKSQLD